MKLNRRFVKFSIIAVSFIAVLVCARLASVGAQNQSTGLPHDWSHRHVVFSNPGTIVDALSKMEPGSVETWYKTVSSSRFRMQQVKRDLQAHASSSTNNDSVISQLEDELESLLDRLEAKKAKKIKGDWAQSLGSGGTVGADNYPAKYSFTGAVNCSDFVVFNTSKTGASNLASIIAFKNIYVTANGGACGAAPTVNWAYNTAGGTISTSVVLSLDGTQLAFVQSVGSAASLVILKPLTNGALSVTAPQTLTSTPAASYRGCTAPCMTTLALGANDTNSAPFVDYDNDVLYVGDDSGVLHKFTHIFSSGTPAEITGGGAASGWPQTIDSKVLTSPVGDSTSGNVFVGSAGGKLFKIPGGGAATGGGSSNVVASDIVANGLGIVEAPLVDPTAQRVYVFAADGTSVNFKCNGGHACSAAVIQFSTTDTTLTTLSVKVLGGTNTSASGNASYIGTFDNNYYTSTASNPSGALYVCAQDINTSVPTLYQVTVASNALLTVTTGPVLAAAGGVCSPVTEFFNSPTDYIFLSVTTGKTTSPINCPAATGCVMSFNVTSASGFGSTTATTGRATATGGTSGIVIDNTGAASGGAQVYYSPLSTGAPCSGSNGCAVQASQAGL